jgi:hypothetical protein
MLKMVSDATKIQVLFQLKMTRKDLGAILQCAAPPAMTTGAAFLTQGQAATARPVTNLAKHPVAPLPLAFGMPHRLLQASPM